MEVNISNPIYSEKVALGTIKPRDSCSDKVTYVGKVTNILNKNTFTIFLNDDKYQFTIPDDNLTNEYAIYHLLGKETAVICEKEPECIGEVYSAITACTVERYDKLGIIITDFDSRIEAIISGDRINYKTVECELIIDDNDQNIRLNNVLVNSGDAPEIPIYHIATDKDGCKYIGDVAFFEAKKEISGKYYAKAGSVRNNFGIFGLIDDSLYNILLSDIPDITDKLQILERISNMQLSHRYQERILYKKGFIDKTESGAIETISDLTNVKTIMKLLGSETMRIGRKHLDRLTVESINNLPHGNNWSMEQRVIREWIDLTLSIIPVTFDYNYVKEIVSSDPILKYFSSNVIRFVTKPGSSLLITGPRQSAQIISKRICRLFDLSLFEYIMPTLVSSTELQGTSRRYSNSDSGRIISNLLGEDDPGKAVFFFRDLDLVNSSVTAATDGDPIAFIPNLLYDGSFYDSFFEGSPDISPVRSMANAAAATCLRDGFASSFKERINLSILNNNQSLDIAEKLFMESSLSADRETFQFLLDRFCGDDCIGELQKYSCQIHEIINNGNEIVKITTDDLIYILGEGIPEGENIYSTIRKNIDSYPKETVRKINDTLNEIRAEKGDSETRNNNERKLRILARTAVAQDATRSFDIDLFRSQVSHLIGLSPQKRRLESMLSAWTESKSSKPLAILLEGPPGNGKTSIVNIPDGNVGKIPVYKRSLVGITPEGIKGSPNIGPGLITEHLADVDSNYYILVLDDVHRAFPETRQALLDAIDGQKFYDNFLGISVDLSNIIFIFISNSYEMEPEFIDRLSVIEFPGYSIFEKKEILINKLIPEYEKNYGVKIYIDDKSADLLVKRRASSSARDLETAFEGVFSAKYTNNSHKGFISITEGDIEANVRKYHSIPDRNGVYALGVTNIGGGITERIVCVHKEAHGDMKYTGGLIGSSAMESVSDAFQACSSIMGSDFNPNKFYLKLGSSGLEKDGPSAGVAIAVALAFTLHDIEPAEKYALTGEINPDGTIDSVGGLRFKLQAAYVNNIQIVFIPNDEYDDELIGFIEELNRRGMHIFQVGHIREVLAQIPELSDSVSFAQYA